MITAGHPLSRGAVYVDPETLANMAEKSGRHIEFSPRAAHLTIGRQRFMAVLPSAGGAQ